MKIELDIQDVGTLEFLKQFVTNHYPESEDNLYTDRPIHLVQSKSYVYAPYDSVTFGEYDDWEICFIETYDYTVYDNEVEFLKEHCDIEDAKSYEELEGQELTLNGGSFVIYDYDDYFKYYGVDSSEYEIATRKHYWETRAYFFIRKEAERYKKYQAHNLGESRIYTDSYGYSNCGEWTKFYDLLLSIGNKVQEVESNDK